ncbi:response regulator transcription factor [Comamonas terrigena]|uniref:response regulator transcription factor n=1 Tax=Comamonas terrigena TaxID=32013 RepID=UPI0024498467|nr:response regulator transcription factor [Comamonas terrigena]MDH1291106.1 response regulator transcription factor [Comamonas terrigena]
MKVLVLSDNKIYGDAMDSILCQGFQAATVRIAESVGSAFIAMETQSTDILLLDVRVEGTLPSLPALRFRWPATYMVAFGVDTPGQDSHCQRSKMDRIFYKQATAGDLLHVLKDYGSKAHAARTLPAERWPSAPAPTLLLSARERQVAGLLEQGFSNKEIARRLEIELATVKNHVHNLLEKLNVKSRLEASVKLRRAPDPRVGDASFKP